MTAKKEPICKPTSISIFWFSKLKYSEIIIRWDDELTGINSVIPWIKDKINISIILKVKIYACQFNVIGMHSRYANINHLK